MTPTELKQAAEKVIELDGKEFFDYRKRRGAPWYFGKPVYMVDLRERAEAHRFILENARAIAERMLRLEKALEKCKEQRDSAWAGEDDEYGTHKRRADAEIDAILKGEK